VLVELTDSDMTVLIHMQLMRYGAPFHRTPKPGLNKTGEAMMDDCTQRLRMARDRLRVVAPAPPIRRPVEARDGASARISMTEPEIRLYIKWLQASLEEHKGDYYELELFVAHRSRVQECLRKLKAALLHCKSR
jgi:hypothetical protein